MVMDELFRSLPKTWGIYEKIDFLDDNNPIAIENIAEMGPFTVSYDEAFCTMGNNKIRKTLLEEAECEIGEFCHVNAGEIGRASCRERV